MEECRKVGYAIAHSPLTKTAFLASDHNFGRVLVVIRHASAANKDADGVLVVESGERAASYKEEDGARV